MTALRWSVIDFEVLHGEQNQVVKEVSVAAENVIDISFQFPIPHVSSLLRRKRTVVGRRTARLCQASRNHTRGRLGIHASVRVWHRKDQISLKLAGATRSKSGGF